MKKIYHLVIMFIINCCLLSATTADNNEYINLCTFNIHNINGGDTISWDAPTYRKYRVMNVFSAYNFDIAGCQEVSKIQKDDIESIGYSSYGLGVNTGTESSTDNHNTIFYKSARFTVMAKGTFWLSPTPKSISIGWDAAQRRNCNWVKLKDNNTQKIFYYFSAHFDHLGAQARLESAKQIADTLPVIAGDYPAFFMGDLNTTETTDPIAVLDARLNNSRDICLTAPQGPYGTGHGWRINVDVRRIDYIYTYNGNGRNRIEVHEYEVIDTTFDGKAPSDHWPVRLKVRFVNGPASLRVTSSLDNGGEGTLRSIIASAQDGDSIYVDRRYVNTIKLDSAITANKNLTINANGATIKVASPGVSTYRLFTFGGDTSVKNSIRLSNAILQGGDISSLSSNNAYGGVILINKNVNLYAKNIDFMQGKAIYGGGIHCTDTIGVSIRMDSCRFTGNVSTNNAGAFYNKGVCQLNQCSFSNNSTGRNGSAIVSNRIIRIQNTSFTNNQSITSQSSDYGSALFNTGNGLMTIENCLFDSNKSLSVGTGAFASSGSETQTDIINCTFWGNSGATSSTIYNRAGTINMVNNTIAGNMTTTGSNGAYYCYPSVDSRNYLVNSIIAYNYQTNDKTDLTIGENALLQGSYNIIGSLSGTANLENAIAFQYASDTNLFSSYTNVTFNTSTINVPVLNDNGANTKTIAIDESSAAYRTGTNSYTGLSIPRFDQRNYTRYIQPCLGAFEIICGFPSNLSISNLKGASVTLQWEGAADIYHVAYKAESSTEWKTITVNAKSTHLDKISPCTTYDWKVRSVCSEDFPGEWLAGPNFTTPFRSIVTSGLDDGNTESLRYIIANSAINDCIIIDVDTITLTDVLSLEKNIRINGQGAVIKTTLPKQSTYRIFNLGANTTSKDTICLYNMELQGGDLSTSSNNGGVLFLNKNVQLLAKDVIFRDGKAVYSGAIHCNDSTGIRVFMDKCSFLNNSATNNAGAIYLKGLCKLTSCVFDGNTTSSNGSAIASMAPTSLRQCVFRNNKAIGSGSYGASIFQTGGTQALIEDCLFESNTATTTGTGALSTSTATTNVTLTNCTFHGNSGITSSAIYNRGGTISLINCTVSGNKALSNSVGAYYAYPSSSVATYLVNSILAYNHTPAAYYDAVYGTGSITGGSNNIIGTANSNPGFGNTIPFSYGNATPLFNSYTSESGFNIPDLTANGGFSKTIALSGEQSVAYQCGVSGYSIFNIPTEDQRGISRNYMPCLGSYEYIPEGTSLKKIEETSTRLFPNPASDYLNIQTSSKLLEASIYDFSGLKVENIDTTFYRVSSLKDGIYLVKIKTGNGESVHPLIIKH